MSEAPTYEIVKVWDFLNVPEDRLEECLREFAVALHMARHGLKLLEATADAMALSDQCAFHMGPAFKWVDDGKRTATLTIGPGREP